MAVKQPWALDAQSFGRVCVDQKRDWLSVLRFVLLVVNSYSWFLLHYAIGHVRGATAQTAMRHTRTESIMILGNASTRLSVVVSASTARDLESVPVGAWRTGT